MILNLFCLYTLPTGVSTIGEVAKITGMQNAANSKWTRLANNIQLPLIGISLLAGVLGLQAQDYQVYDKLKRMLGWKPIPLNKPASAQVNVTTTPILPQQTTSTTQTTQTTQQPASQL